MGELNISDPNIETDNVPWSSTNDKSIILAKELCDLQTYSSDDEDLNSKSTVSISDLQEYDKQQIETSVGQLNIIKSSGVHIGNQCYYNGDVTIQQFVVNNKDGDHSESLPHTVANLNFTPIDRQSTLNKQEQTKQAKNFSFLKWKHVLCGLLVIIAVVSVATTLLLLTTSGTQDQGWDSELSENSTLILYSREDWQAVPSRHPIKPLKVNPPRYVIICHTAGRNCSTFLDCSLVVRDIQFDQMGRGWDDLGMHFLVGGDGAAYTGLGWGKHGSHTIPFNRKSIAIYFIGTFMFQLPPKKQITAAKLLIEEGVRLGKIAKNYKLFAHKQVMATESPGAELIENIKTWPHWSAYETSDDLDDPTTDLVTPQPNPDNLNETKSTGTAPH